MPKKKGPELTREEQFERFVKTARKRGVDETGEEFERLFKKVVPPKPRGTKLDDRRKVPHKRNDVAD